MMNKTITLRHALILAVLLGAFSNPTMAGIPRINICASSNTIKRSTDFPNPGRGKNDVAASGVTYIKTDTGGRSVSLDSAQQCIARFTTVMQNHGFSSVAGQPVNIHIKKTSMITTGESFSGKNLQEWLNSTMALYAAENKTLIINVQLGIYDDSYLNTYQPNASLRSSNKDRIAIFLVPADASTGQPVRVFSALSNNNNPPPPGGTGFDLGGVQP